MANQIVFVIAEIHGLRIYAIMLPSSDFSVAHCWSTCNLPIFLYKLHVFCELHLFAEYYIRFCNYYMFRVSSACWSTFLYHLPGLLRRPE